MNKREAGNQLFMGCLAGGGILVSAILVLIFVINVFQTDNPFVLGTVILAMSAALLWYIIRLFAQNWAYLAIGILVGVFVTLIWINSLIS